MTPPAPTWAQCNVTMAAYEVIRVQWAINLLDDIRRTGLPARLRIPVNTNAALEYRYNGAGSYILGAPEAWAWCGAPERVSTVDVGAMLNRFATRTPLKRVFSDMKTYAGVY